MARETTLAVVMGGEDTGPKTFLSGGGICSKVFKKVKNVLNFIKGLKSGRNRQVEPPRTDISGSDTEWSENLIIGMMEKQELSKAVFMLAVPMSTGLLFMKSDTLSRTVVHFTLVSNVAGCTAIWNGILLRKTCSRIASVVEQAGVSLVFLGFHMLIANYLSPELRFFPAICWGFSMLPFVIAAMPASGTDQQGVKEEAVCPV